MIIDPVKTDALFAELAEKVRSSVRQSHDSLLQASQRRLSQNPRDCEAIHVLAAYSLQNRDPERSLATLQRDPDVLDNDPIGNRLAGYAYLAQSDVESARHHFDRSVRLDPCQSDCWAMLGKIHEDSGQHEWAVKYYQRAILFEDSQHESTLALSELYVRCRRRQDAIHTLRVSLLRDRRSAKLNLALAKLLQRRAAKLGRNRKRRAQRKILEEACRCFQTANSSEPSSAAYVAQGIIEQKLERFTEAYQTFQRAVSSDPDCPAARTHLANANIDAGCIEQALTQYQSVIASDPDRAGPHFRFSRAKRFRQCEESETYVRQLEELVSDANRPRRDQIQLNFALAKVLDDIGNHDRAWQHYDRANRLKPGHTRPIHLRQRQLKPVSPRRLPLQDVADKTIRFFSKAFLKANRDLGNPSKTPVFIIGMPRSGTTLTEQILSSHPAIAGAGELKLIDQIRRDVVRDYQGRESASVYPDLLARLDRASACELAGGYLSHLDSIRTDQQRVTDKMPTNFIHLGLIALLFPRATVIHCRRNPMDVLVSCYCQNLSPPFCDLDQLVHYHRQYRRMMAHWYDVLPLKIHTVDYESLVADPESNSRALIEHCGVSWDDRCLSFHKNERAVHTPSKWQVRQPMYSSSIEKWRRFEPFLGQIAKEIAEN
jgi:tetratricopeptide (TPR) repeat protein